MNFDDELNRFGRAEREAIEERVAIMMFDGYVGQDRAYEIAINDMKNKKKQQEELIKRWVR